MASPPYQCRVCPRGFNSQNALNAHMRTHKGKKPARSPAFRLPIISTELGSSSASTLEIHSKEAPERIGTVTVPPKKRRRITGLDLNKSPTEEDNKTDCNKAGAAAGIQESDPSWAKRSEIDLNKAVEARTPKKQFDLNELPINEDGENDDNAGDRFGA